MCVCVCVRVRACVCVCACACVCVCIELKILLSCRDYDKLIINYYCFLNLGVIMEPTLVLAQYIIMQAQNHNIRSHGSDSIGPRSR